MRRSPDSLMNRSGGEGHSGWVRILEPECGDDVDGDCCWD